MSASNGKHVAIPRPLRVMFLHTIAHGGGAETLMASLIRRLDRSRFAPELCCLKSLGALGEELAREIPAFEGLLGSKYDLRVLPRLTGLLRRRGIDAIISVGAGDKMFWGRLAARAAGVSTVICSIHSTGWPDRIGRLNHALTPLTDMFVAVAETHGRYLVEDERLPVDKVCVISNGVDIELYRPRRPDSELRRRLGIPPGPVAGTVARLGAVKNHEMFLDVAARVRHETPDAQFVIVGDGELRESLEERARRLGVGDCVHFLGWRSDVPDVLALMDVFLLTSHIEANPVSILEAFAVGVPVVSTRVGSVPDTVREDRGFLVEPGDAEAMTRATLRLFRDPGLARAMGAAGRRSVVEHWSVDQMVRQYEDLIEQIHYRKRLLPLSHEPAAENGHVHVVEETDSDQREDCVVCG
ncbi:MAG TPA: glycosyltransferase [Thermoguttaceae bacterium]|nr:glycosyltransferase [Thermoguttaceae bacterium]